MMMVFKKEISMARPKKKKMGRPVGSKNQPREAPDQKRLIAETVEAVKLQLLAIAAGKKTKAVEKMMILDWVRRN